MLAKKNALAKAVFSIIAILALGSFQGSEVCAAANGIAEQAAVLPNVSEAFPAPANAAEQAKLELELSHHPTPVEIAWQKQGLYGFMHFGIATAGIGKPEKFNPTQLDCHQWIKTYKAAGCKIVILTTKHHDGFCLWNSRYTRFSVARSPWKDGKGDVIREFVDACRAESVQPGLYISTADGSQRQGRGFGDYYDNGSPAIESVIPTPVAGRPFPPGHKEFKLPVDDYNRFTLNQLYELVTEYGPIAQIWFDAPVPMPGIKQVYNNDAWHNMVRQLSPDTVLLGYSGGGVKYKPGYWRPHERIWTVMPYWFYRAEEDAQLTPSQDLLRMYFSCGVTGAVYAPGVAPDATGILPASEVEILEKTGAVLRRTLGKQAGNLGYDGQPNPANRAAGAPAALLDNNTATVWTPDATGPCTVSFTAKEKSNLFLIQEDVTQGQRVRAFTLERNAGDQWETILTGSDIGIKRIFPIPTVNAGAALRLCITSSKAKPRLDEIGLFHFEPLLMPAIHRGADDRIVIAGPPEAVFHFTLDGSAPTAQSAVYTSPFDLPQGGWVRAVSVQDNQVSDPAAFAVGLSKKKWKVVACNNQEPAAPASAILDDDLATEWHSRKGAKEPPADSEINGEIKEAWGLKSQKKSETANCFVILDLGETQTVNGFTYYPGAANPQWGASESFALYASNDLAKFDRPFAGPHFCYGDEAPRQHVVHFAQPVTGRFFRIEVTGCNRPGFAAADIGLLGK